LHSFLPKIGAFIAQATNKIRLSLGLISVLKLPRTAKNTNGHLLEKDGFNCHEKH